MKKVANKLLCNSNNYNDNNNNNLDAATFSSCIQVSYFSRMGLKAVKTLG